MSTKAATNLLWLPQGERFPVIRPQLLATDWTWDVVERDDPTTVKDFSPATVLNATRYQFIDIDDRYSVDVAYRVRVYDSTPSIVDQGDFQVVKGTFGSADLTTLVGLNAQLDLALGLAGLNVRWEHLSHDRRTGIPVRSRLTIYSDNTLSEILATYILRRRLNSVGQVVGEIQYAEAVEDVTGGT